MNSNSVLLIFLDGVGIGESHDKNPLSVLKDIDPLDVYKGKKNELFSNGVMILTDACLGVEGRPQSASGHTTIYTGINAPKELGYHKHGFPNAALREIIEENSIFLQIEHLELGAATFANTYTPGFFEKTPRWKSATTVATEAAGIRLHRLPDLLGRKSIFHDFTNRSLIASGFDVPEFSPEQAGKILVSLLEDFRFVLYEHFITDKIGHSMDWAKAKHHLPELARFLREVIKTVDLSTTTVVITSDHGNLEDLSIKNHTRNPVPTLVWGKEKKLFEERVSSLADITPCIIEALKAN